MAAFTLTVLRERASLATLVPAWEELTVHSLEPNPFYEPWILLPALEARGGANLRCVLLWQGDKLAGFFPFTRERHYKGLPVSTLTSWRHSAYLVCTPLVRADVAVDVLKALLAWRGAEASARAPRTSIIALTAHAANEDRQACIDAGMDGFLTKPFNRERLAEALRTAVRADTLAA